MIFIKIKKAKVVMLLLFCTVITTLFAQNDQVIKKVTDSAIYAKEMSHAGNKYFESGNFEMAAKTFFKSLDIAERKGYKSIAATNYNNISATYFETENYPQGIVYAQKAILAFKSLKDTLGLANAYNSLANVYYMQEKDALCLHYFSESIKNRLLINDSAGLYKSYKNLGATYFEMGDTARGIQQIKQSTRYIRSKNDTQNWFTSYLSLAEAYIYSGQLEKGKKYLDSCTALLPKVQNISKKEDYHYIVYQYHAKKGNLKDALLSYEKYGNYRDSVINIEKNDKLSELNIKYETEKKQKLIQRQQFEISRKNYWLIIICIAVVMMNIAAYFIYLSIRHKQDRKLQQEIFRQQEIGSIALFEGEQQERIRIARDLHDGVGQMLSLVKMNLSTMEKEDPVIEKTKGLVDKTIDEVRNVSHNLMPEELNFGIMAAFASLADKVNSSGDIHMEMDIPEEIEKMKFTKQNELSIYRIVQEVINNMIKHAQASMIYLSVGQIKDGIIIAIKDNGRGLEDGAINNSKGIGWKNINARVHLMDGKIKVQSEKLSGTQIEITLPKDGE